jgi:hypothetical protein
VKEECWIRSERRERQGKSLGLRRLAQFWRQKKDNRSNGSLYYHVLKHAKSTWVHCILGRSPFSLPRFSVSAKSLLYLPFLFWETSCLKGK